MHAHGRTRSLSPAPIWTDLKTFDIRPWRGILDMLIGGYPCQPFSSAGKRNGIDDPRHLWPYIARLIHDGRPDVCFFENVYGHVSRGLDVVLNDLEGLGYTTSVGTFNASDVDAPHKRTRVFILAHASGARLEKCIPVQKVLAEPPNPWIWNEHVAGCGGNAVTDWGWSAETVFRGMDDGPSDWVDRIKACGNGVVPLEAAYAFSTLAEELGLIK